MSSRTASPLAGKPPKQSQHSPPAGASSREEIDLLKRLSELSRSKSVKSGELLKLLRSLALFDKDEVEVEIFVSVVEKTFVPLLKSFIGKDSDDARKVINLLHYFIRRAMSTANMLELHTGKASTNTNHLLGELGSLNGSVSSVALDNLNSRSNSNYADENVFEAITNTLIREEVFSGQKTAEINHKHIPRRMEALRTISNIFLAQPDPSIQEIIARSLLIYDEAMGVGTTSKKTRRVSAWKKETNDKWLMSQVALGCAYRCLLASGDSSSLLTELSLKIVVRALASNNPSSSRHAARFLFEAVKRIPHEIAPILLEQVMPRMPKNTKSTAPPNQLSHEDHFTATRMLDLYSHLVIQCSDEQGISSKFFKAIVVVMCNDRRWRIRLHAARALAHAASKSWNKLQDCYVCANDEGLVFDTIMNAGNDVNRHVNNAVGSAQEGRTRSKSLETAFNMKLMFSLANMLAEALSLATQIYSKEQHGVSKSSGGDLPPGRGGADETDTFQDNMDVSGENDIPNDFSSSILFFHAILRTIAAVGRQHIRYVFVANHKSNLGDDFSGNAIHGTQALRATLTSQISFLTDFPIASIRLQAMFALLWLTPAPSEYHNSQSDEDGVTYINDLKHFRKILYSIKEFPREMGMEFLHSFKERICLSPSLTPLLLRWYHYPFARNAYDTKHMVELWNMCSDLGAEPRQWTLRQIFALLDGDHPAKNSCNVEERYISNRSKLCSDLQELQRAAIAFVGKFGHELCHPTSAARKWRLNGEIESLFAGRKHVQNVSMKIANIVKIRNKCIAALLLKLFRYAWFSAAHTRLVALEALLTLGSSPYACAATILVIFEFFASIRSHCDKFGNSGTWMIETIIMPGIKLLEGRLNDIKTTVESGVVWKPTKVIDLKYSVAQKLKQSLIQTGFGIDNGDLVKMGTFEIGNIVSDERGLFPENEMLIPGVYSPTTLVNASSTSGHSDDTNWMSFSPTAPSNSDEYLDNRNNSLLDFDGFVSNTHETGDAKETSMHEESSAKIDVTNPFAS